MKKILLAAAACAVAVAAFASVTFDPATGKGFVGKGDVQIPFGWSNAQVQANATAVTFKFESSDSYAAVCTWTTGEGTRGEKTHTISRTRTVGVAGTVDGDPRQVKGQKQFTGFILAGYVGTPITQGTAPELGQSCPGNGTDGAWTSVTLVGSNVALFATFNGVDKKIWPPAL
jgi:hypothetical protein